ncbi:MAG: hypothetical protein PUG21_01210 [Prevotella sp.]|nr:hypothetical protein [Prevotella sp.]
MSQNIKHSYKNGSLRSLWGVDNKEVSTSPSHGRRMKRRLLLLFVLLTATIGMAQEKEMNIKAEEISYQEDIY